jgi:hypothetical protein
MAQHGCKAAIKQLDIPIGVDPSAWLQPVFPRSGKNHVVSSISAQRSAPHCIFSSSIRGAGGFGTFISAVTETAQAVGFFRRITEIGAGQVVEQYVIGGIE